MELIFRILSHRLCLALVLFYYNGTEIRFNLDFFYGNCGRSFREAEFATCFSEKDINN